MDGENAVAWAREARAAIAAPHADPDDRRDLKLALLDRWIELLDTRRSPPPGDVSALVLELWQKDDRLDSFWFDFECRATAWALTLGVAIPPSEVLYKLSGKWK